MSKRLHYILSMGAFAGAIAALTTTGSSAQQATPREGEQRTTTTTMERSTTTPAKNLRTVTLVVKEVDRAAHKVTFEAKVSPEANLQRDGMPIKIDQLQKGESLRLMVDPTTGEVVKAEVTRKMAE